MGGAGLEVEPAVAAQVMGAQAAGPAAAGSGPHGGSPFDAAASAAQPPLPFDRTGSGLGGFAGLPGFSAAMGASPAGSPGASPVRTPLAAPPLAPLAHTPPPLAPSPVPSSVPSITLEDANSLLAGLKARCNGGGDGCLPAVLVKLCSQPPATDRLPDPLCAHLACPSPCNRSAATWAAPWRHCRT